MTKTPRTTVWHLTDAALEIRAEAELPAGIAGRVSGVALTYEVVDSYGTMFARKCAKRSIDGRVAARKVPLLMDHERTSKAHVGVITSMSDAGDALVMSADIFDTAEGRSALEYVKAVLASGSSTGFSIGFVPRASEMVTVDNRTVERFTEIELREVSITPMPAVPGAEIASARNEVQEAVSERTENDLLTLAARVALDALPDSERLAVLSRYLPPTRTETATVVTPAVTTTPTSTETTARYASLAERASAIRSTYTTH
jgi:HK97 family phage prohead protease